MEFATIRKTAGIACTLALAATCLALVGCGDAPATDADGHDIVRVSGVGVVPWPEPFTGYPHVEAQPSGASLQPSDHNGRFESGGATLCNACHADGADPSTGATPLPDSHYVTGTDGTRQVDPLRNQCITCHVVDLG